MLACVLDERGWKLDLWQRACNCNSSTYALKLKTRYDAASQIAFRLPSLDRVFLSLRPLDMRSAVFGFCKKLLFLSRVPFVVIYFRFLHTSSLKQKLKMSNRSARRISRADKYDLTTEMEKRYTFCVLKEWFTVLFLCFWKLKSMRNPSDFILWKSDWDKHLNNIVSSRFVKWETYFQNSYCRYRWCCS